MVHATYAGPLASGAIYEYVRQPAGDFAYVSTLVSPTPSNANNFGASMAMDGDSLLVGARSEQVSGSPTFPGGVHLFTRTQGQWVSIETWRPSTGTSASAFGATVLFAGNGFVVTEPGWHGEQRGRFNVFPARTGDGRTTLLPPQLPSYMFSEGIAVSPGRIAATSLTTGTGTGTIVGGVHIYELEADATLTLRASLPDPEPSPSDLSRFGAEVVALGSSYFVSAPRRLNLPIGESGIIYMIALDPGTGSYRFVDRFSVPGGTQSLTLFGEAMAVDGERLVVGAPSEQSGAGNVYVFTIPLFRDGFE